MRRFFVPLFWKFSIAIVAIVAVFGSINMQLIWNKVYRSLDRESEKRARFIGFSLAQQAVDPLLYEDYVALQNLLVNVQQIDSTVAYAFILDANRQVLVHTFADGFPRGLLNANPLPAGHAERVALLVPADSPGMILRDIAVPLLHGKLGQLHVGIREASIRRDVVNTIKTLLLMVAVFLTIGLIGAFLFAHFINNPVKEISRVADQLDLQALQFRSQPRIAIRERLLGRWRIPWRAEDELDILADKFNGMIQRLEDAYRELQNAQNTLVQSEKLASVGTLAAGIAHEINNPIAGLQSCVRRIQRNPQNMEQNQKYLQMMDQAMGRIERVVKGLLAFARKEELDFAPVDCRQIIEKALLLVAYNLEKARISVTREIPPDLPLIHASENHLQQVLVNLLVNGIQAVQQRRASQPDCPARISIRVTVAENCLRIAVSDSGSGISPEALEKIFDPFFTTKRVGEGTGLGLAISRKIVTAHSGRIIAESRQGEGTTMFVELPIGRGETIVSGSYAYSR